MAGLRVVTNAGLVALVVVVLASVVVRYFGIFGGSLHWTSELARFIIVWVVMLGSAVAFDYSAHVAIDFTGRLPRVCRRVVRTMAYLLSLAFILVLAWQGYRLSSLTMRQISPALGLPFGYFYLAIPVGASIIAVQSALFVVLPRLQKDGTPVVTEDGPAGRV
jgi:TRAP-type transport system small permease protein